MVQVYHKGLRKITNDNHHHLTLSIFNDNIHIQYICIILNIPLYGVQTFVETY